MCANEEWRPVVGYEGLYEVSNRGRVRSLVFRNKVVSRVRAVPKILTPWLTDSGYWQLHLSSGGKKRGRMAHVLMLQAFRGLPPSGHVAAHLDGNPANCCLCNLAWVTRRENEAHKKLHGTSLDCARNHRALLSDDQVHEIRTGGARDVEYARRFGVSVGTVAQARVGQSWSRHRTPARLLRRSWKFARWQER